MTEVLKTTSLTAILASMGAADWRVYLEKLPIADGPRWRATVRPHAGLPGESDWFATAEEAVTDALRSWKSSNGGRQHDVPQTSAPKAYKRHPLNDFGDRWALNGDVIHCRGCEREQHIADALDDFPHKPHCRYEEAEYSPWKSLGSLITAQIAKAKRHSNGL